VKIAASGLLFLAALLPVSLSMQAQTSAATGALEGWVFDKSEATVAGARITIHNQETNLQRSIDADSRGYFRITDLPIGLYALQVSQPGFSPFKQNDLTINLGATLRLDVHLQFGTQSQQMTVSELPPEADPSQTSMTSTVGRERIEESPVRTRNALDFVLMEPNIVPTSNTSAAGNVSAPAGSGFSFGGMRPTSNRIAIDGMENDDDFTGGSRTELSPETVQEFQVINNGISAEAGGSSGGAVNVVTRTGANTMHGDAFVFLQNGTLDARPPIEEVSSAPDLNRYRVGAANGGAIVRNRTLYYVAFEQEHERSQIASDISSRFASAINSALASGLYPNLRIRSLTTGFSPTAHAETEASFRIDQQLSRQMFSLRYVFTINREAGDAFHNDGLTDASGRGSSFLHDHTAAGSWTYAGSANAINAFRAQFSQRNAVLRSNQSSGPEMVIDGLVDFGRSYQGNQNHNEKHGDAADTYSWNRGKHLLQAGGAVTYVHESTLDEITDGGLFVFANMQDFLARQAAIYRQTFGSPHTDFAAPTYGGFFQDHWVISHVLTADAGIRYDLQQLPDGIHSDHKDFSPRAGFAFHPIRQIVLRGGYGVFFDRYLLSALNRLIVSGAQGFEQVGENGQAIAALQTGNGGLLSAPLPGILPSIYRAGDNLPTPYSQQGSFGAQYSIARDVTASANYLWVKGVKLPRTNNVNLLPPDMDSGVPVFSALRVNPAYNSIYHLENTARSDYNGLSLAFRVMRNDFTLDTSYTLSQATDDASSWDEQPQDPYAFRQEHGLSLFNVRNRLVLSGLFDLPIGDDEDAKEHVHRGRLATIFSNLELAPILTAESGRPLNPLTGIDTTGNESNPLSSRPAGFGRNSLTTPALFSLDLRLLKAIPMGPNRHLDLVAESFNLLNRTNVTTLNPFFGAGAAPAPSFLTPVEALPARQIEFSLDFEF
jgi:hypothetical protein